MTKNNTQRKESCNQGGRRSHKLFRAFSDNSVSQQINVKTDRACCCPPSGHGLILQKGSKRKDVKRQIIDSSGHIRTKQQQQKQPVTALSSS